MTHSQTTVYMIPPMPYVDHGWDEASRLWAVSLPGCPGCIAQGGTLSEAVHALANIFPRYLEHVMRLFEETSLDRARLLSRVSRLPEESPKP